MESSAVAQIWHKNGRRSVAQLAADYVVALLARLDTRCLATTEPSSPALLAICRLGEAFALVEAEGQLGRQAPDGNRPGHAMRNKGLTVPDEGVAWQQIRWDPSMMVTGQSPHGKWRLRQRLVKTGGRLLKNARYYWLLLAESHLTRRLVGSMLRRMEGLPLPAG